MSEELFAEIRRAKAENYAKKSIVRAASKASAPSCSRGPFELMYERCLADLAARDESSFIFRHHIRRVSEQLSHYERVYDWESDPDQTVVDYIASMTDGYFAELAQHWFPDIHFPAARLYQRGALRSGVRSLAARVRAVGSVGWQSWARARECPTSES